MKRILPKIDFLPCILLERESKTFFQLEIELRADIWKMEYNNLKKGVFSVLKVDRMLCSKKERREEEKKRMAKVANIMKLKMRYSASSQEKKGEKKEDYEKSTLFLTRTISAVGTIVRRSLIVYKEAFFAVRTIPAIISVLKRI